MKNRVKSKLGYKTYNEKKLTKKYEELLISPCFIIDIHVIK